MLIIKKRERMKKYIGILLVFMFSLLSAPVIADSTSTAGDAAATIKAVNSTVETVAVNVEGVNKNLVFVADKLEAVMNTMSAKLGVASDKVWEILVYKHTIAGYFWLCLLIFTVALWIMIVLYFNYHAKQSMAWEVQRGESKSRLNQYYEDRAQIIVIMVISAILTVATTTVCFITAQEGFMNMLRPEVGAMDEALRLIRSII